MRLKQVRNPDYSMLAAFNQPIERPKTGHVYHLCLALVAAAMLVLPILYLGFVGILIWAVYHHAVYHWRAIMNWGGSLMIGYVIIAKFLIYAAPLLAGIAAIFFMFKPLLAGRPRRAQPLALNPADNPLLYAFIAKISDAVGAPAPQRIYLDCELNASASFRRGFRSMLGNDLVLTLGLPLVANLSTRELAGVVAHEFGHFTQGAGMRLSYIIRSINFWFSRVAYERDAWDEAMEDWANEIPDYRAAIIVWTVQVAVWSCRLILKLLAISGHIVAGFMLRQMEYDADAYQIKVAGTETFEATHRKLATLEAAVDGTYQQIKAQWKRSRQLPDNFCELVRQLHENLPAKVLKKIDDELGFRRTSLFDTHPSPADRIRRGRLAGEPGIFHDDQPASSLFSSFEHPARFVTLLHYTDDIGIPVTEPMLLHVESKQSGAARGYATPADPREEFFFGLLPMLLPLSIHSLDSCTDQEAALAELNQLCAGLEQIAGQVAPLGAQFNEACQRRLNAQATVRLLEKGVVLRAGGFGLAAVTVEAAHALEAENAAACDSLRDSLKEVAAALRRRLELALILSRTANEPASSRADEVTELVHRLNEAAANYTHRKRALDALGILDYIYAVGRAEGETPALLQAVDKQKELVVLLVARPVEKSVSPAVGTPLRLSREAAFVGATEIDSIRQDIQQWFASYEKDIRRLAEIALAAEHEVM